MQRLNALARPRALGAVKDGASRQVVTALAGKLHHKAELTVAERRELEEATIADLQTFAAPPETSGSDTDQEGEEGD